MKLFVAISKLDEPKSGSREENSGSPKLCEEKCRLRGAWVDLGGGKEDMPGRVGWESATLVPNLALALTSGKSLPVLP